ncbi:50S ribosomal protein L4 [Candidatus Parcubacteria bacterium]|nr:50S ribosomal protein L4 [Candidatus Parcubacteria bacterium]
MKAKVFNQEGQIVKEIELPKEIFGLKINPDLLHQVVVSQMANKRKPIAHTKDRSEVSGGGKKPWPQKHLGRARHGSIRSPLWRKGGVTFGPRKEKNYKKKIPKAMKRKALLMALSGKMKDGEIIFLEDLNLQTPKTKQIAKLLENLKIKGKSILLVLPQKNENLKLAARNIPKLKTIMAKDLNPLDILSKKYLLFPIQAIEVVKNTFCKTS